MHWVAAASFRLGGSTSRSRCRTSQRSHFWLHVLIGCCCWKPCSAVEPQNSIRGMVSWIEKACTVWAGSGSSPERICVVPCVGAAAMLLPLNCAALPAAAEDDEAGSASANRSRDIQFAPPVTFLVRGNTCFRSSVDGGRGERSCPSSNLAKCGEDGSPIGLMPIDLISRP